MAALKRVSGTFDYENAYTSEGELWDDTDRGSDWGDEESESSATVVAAVAVDDADSLCCNVSCKSGFTDLWEVVSSASSFTSHSPAADGKAGIQVLYSKELRSEMRKKVGELAETLGLTPAVASILFREYRYNKERLLEQYTVDPDAVLKKSGVYHRAVAPVAAIDWTCPICFDDEMGPSLSLPCGNTFCIECLRKFCANAISEGPSCVFTACPESRCSERMTEEEFAAALLVEGGPAGCAVANHPRPKKTLHWRKYTECLVRNFVDNSPLTRWCPGRYCDRVAYAESVAARENDGNVARCKCSTSFCMLCGAEPHAPASCKDLQKWREKGSCASEMWVLEHTQSCPKCLSPIEKRGGCDYMVCQNCKFNFCWKCRSYHPEHYCRQQIVSENDTGGSTRKGHRHDVKRYSHFFNRFLALQEAEQVALRQLWETKASAVTVQEAPGDAVRTDLKFLHATAAQLVGCRHFLKYACIATYFLPSTEDAVRYRLEYQQQMLERLTDKLSLLIEAALKDAQWTENVVHQARALGRFVKNILECFEDGTEMH